MTTTTSDDRLRMAGGDPDSTLDQQVWGALGTVRDPELDEPVTDLGFVAALRTEGEVAWVHLRLPTYFCAPNFAWLMVADAFEAVSGLHGVREAHVELDDHFASDEINRGIAAHAGFMEAFPDESKTELDELRLTFRRKAHTAGVERVSKALRTKGWTVEELVDLRLADLEPTTEAEQLHRGRNDLGISTSPDAYFLVDHDGNRVDLTDVETHLRFARSVRVSVEGNASYCSGLLVTRYGEETKLAQDEKFRSAS